MTVLHVAGGLSFFVVGIVAWIRRPRNRVGLLMTATGVTWFITDLRYLPGSAAFTVADALGLLYFAVLAHLVVAFPGGRLTGRREHALVGVSYAWVIGSNIVVEALWAPPGGNCDCQSNLLVLHRDAPIHDALVTAQHVGHIIITLAVLSAVVRHARSSSGPARRALAPVLWASGPILAVVVALNVAGTFASPQSLTDALGVLTPVALMTLPFSFLVGLLRTTMSRLALGRLIVELHEAPERGRLRAALRRTLADPTLVLVYRRSDTQGWVDAEGRPLELPAGDPSRSCTLLEHEGETVAALVHDSALDDNPALVESVAAAASLAIGNERLQADVRARLAEVRESRARIVEAADAERRRLERDLHDGAQQQLISVALALRTARDGLRRSDMDCAESTLATAAAQLQSAIVELRDIASGIHPPILTEAGLGPALDSLAERAPLPVTVRCAPNRRLADAVEAAAYFAVSECLTNIAKHSGANAALIAARCDNGTLVVDVHDDGRGGAEPAAGSGLRGLADRVAALDGRLSVFSPPGGGTHVRVELPCD